MNIGHQVTMYTELPIMRWVLLDTPGHKVDLAAVHRKMEMEYMGLKPSRTRGHE